MLVAADVDAKLCEALEALDAFRRATAKIGSLDDDDFLRIAQSVNQLAVALDHLK